MALGARAGSALRRAAVDFGEAARRVPIVAAQDSRKGAGANRAGASPCPEFACVRHRLPANMLASAQDRTAEVGVGADRVLIAGGAIGEENYLRALGESLGASFEPLDRLPRRLCPFDDHWLIEAAAQGMLPISENDDLTLVPARRQRKIMGKGWQSNKGSGPVLPILFQLRHAYGYGTRTLRNLNCQDRSL